MKLFIHIVLTAILLLAFACRVNKPDALIFTEPKDPEGVDTADWISVNEGINSGFGNTDFRYSRSKPPEGNITSDISLTGWKGEKVHCQLLFWSVYNESDIIVTTEKSEEDNFIPNNNIIIRTVSYVLADEFLNGCGYRKRDTIPSHLMPDLLDDKNIFSLPGLQTRPVWISIYIPPETDPGDYNIMITGISDSDTVSHNINLEVQNILLPSPSEWSFHLDLWQNPFAVARYHDVQLWSQEHMNLLRPLLTMLAKAGQKCITTTISPQPWGGQTYDPFETMITWIKNSDGFWDYDYSVFDQYVQLAMDCGIDKQINCYSMVPWNNTFTWFDQDSGTYVTGEAMPGSDKYEGIWKPFLNDFKAHLLEMGWLEKTAIALDERGHEEMTNMFNFINESAPDFKVAMAGHFFEDLNTLIYDFSYNWSNISEGTRKVVETRRLDNKVTTYYVACGIPQPNTFTFSPPSESCYIGWLASAMGFNGFLRWAYNSWPENPATDSRFIKWPSGDTYLVYPGAKSSIRFEKLIEGIQDYEKIRILQHELSLNPSMEAAEAEIRLKSFLSGINPSTLDSIHANEITAKGRHMLNEISRLE